jgi:hypothetical protein
VFSQNAITGKTILLSEEKMKSFVDQEKLMACLIRNVKGILQ